MLYYVVSPSGLLIRLALVATLWLLLWRSVAATAPWYKRVCPCRRELVIADQTIVLTNDDPTCLEMLLAKISAAVGPPLKAVTT